MGVGQAVNAVQQQLKGGVRICERNSSAGTKASEEGGGNAPDAGAEIPLQPVVQTMVRPVVPLQPMEVHSGAEIHLQPMEDPMPEQVGAHRRLGPHGKPVLEQAPVRTCSLMERGTHQQVCWQDL
ncbi:hypothetical protein AV530_012827 [Patagioenas fasciata monilis]|uniref:Uncharacterized protein n=1 Tax=Patagioenas fasciata monilis TaxID=372326 RepID=A0A1V4J965_PATFA|nr:hypothetical protein AV530_012827 [Patagioenas fasciata monilis]